MLTAQGTSFFERTSKKVKDYCDYVQSVPKKKNAQIALTDTNTKQANEHAKYRLAEPIIIFLQNFGKLNKNLIRKSKSQRQQLLYSQVFYWVQS